MSNQRIKQLDGLRFLAVFMIFIAHWAQNNFTNSYLQEIPFIHGVTLFFVLSGFLITKSLLIHKDKNVSNGKILKVFYIKRFLRIFPIYYLTLVILLILDFEQTREHFWWLITYTINIYQSINNTSLGHLNHLWSLSVEEQFYLFWPLFILFVNKSKRLLLIVLTIVFSILVKAYLFYEVKLWMATAYFTLACMGALGLGALLAYLTLYKTKYVKTLSNSILLYGFIIFYGLIVILKISSNFPWYKEIFDEFIFAMLSFLLILKASHNGFKGLAKIVLENRFVTYLGKISYGLYLYHLLVPAMFVWFSVYFKFSIEFKPLLFPIYFIITFVLSHFSWILIEKPILEIKNKLNY